MEQEQSESLWPLVNRLNESGKFRVLCKVERPEYFHTDSLSDDEIIKVLLLDTETTGLDPSSAKAIELGLLLVEVSKKTGELGRVLGSYQGFQDPLFPIPAETIAVHGITDEMVAGQSFDTQEVMNLLTQCDYVLAHNAQFDKSFVSAVFSGFLMRPWLCSVNDVDWIAHGYMSSKLGVLVMESGFFHDAHRAVEDCYGLAHVLSSQFMDCGGYPMLEILEKASEPLFKIDAIGSPFDKKDLLKTRGYRWDAVRRMWSTSVSGEDAYKEMVGWLKTEIYGVPEERPLRLGVAKLEGLDRYGEDKPTEVLLVGAL